MANLKKTFGERVRETRAAKNLSQAELAEKAKMHQSDLCDIEKGRHAPTLVTVDRLATALDVPPALLIS